MFTPHLLTLWLAKLISGHILHGRLVFLSMNARNVNAQRVHERLEEDTLALWVGEGKLSFGAEDDLGKGEKKEGMSVQCFATPFFFPTHPPQKRQWPDSTATSLP